MRKSKTLTFSLFAVSLAFGLFVLMRICLNNVSLAAVKTRKLSTIAKSEMKCTTSPAYCQATNVCIIPNEGMFLVEPDSECVSNPASCIWVKMSNFSMSHDAIPMSALLSESEFGYDKFFSPGLIKLQRAGSANSTALFAHDPSVIYLENGLLHFLTAYVPYHFSHLLFNFALPSYTILYGKGIESTLTFDEISKNATLLAHYRSIHRHGDSWHDIVNESLHFDPFFKSAEELQKMNLFVLIDRAGDSPFFPYKMIFPGSSILTMHFELNIPSSFKWRVQVKPDERVSEESILCFPRATLGTAGVSGRTENPLDLGASISALQRAILQDKYNNWNGLTSLQENEMLKSMMVKEVVLTGDGYDNSVLSTTLNITFVNRPSGDRSIRNGADLFESICRVTDEVFSKSGKNIRLVLRHVIFTSSVSLESQIYIVSITNLFMTVHGNAMGFYTFLPFFKDRPVSIIEIQPPEFSSDWFSKSLEPWLLKLHSPKHLYQSFYCPPDRLDYCKISSEQEKFYKYRDFRVLLEHFALAYKKALDNVLFFE